VGHKPTPQACGVDNTSLEDNPSTPKPPNSLNIPLSISHED